MGGSEERYAGGAYGSEELEGGGVTYREKLGSTRVSPGSAEKLSGCVTGGSGGWFCGGMGGSMGLPQAKQNLAVFGSDSPQLGQNMIYLLYPISFIIF